MLILSLSFEIVSVFREQEEDCQHVDLQKSCDSLLKCWFATRLTLHSDLSESGDCCAGVFQYHLQRPSEKQSKILEK